MIAWYLIFLFVVGPARAESDWDRLSKDLQKLTEPQYSAWFVGSLVAGGLTSHWDEAIEYNLSMGSLDPVVQTLDKFSDPLVMFPLASTFRIVTKMNHVSVLDTVSSDLLRSVVLVNCLVAPIKFIFNRQRPEDGGGFSFPSGHAANFAAVATVVARNYNGIYRFGAVAVSGMVFSSRLRGRHHYLSDVVSGAAIGSLTGWVCSRKEYPSSFGMTFSLNRTSMLNLVWLIS
jgi:hypothetical protein